MDDHHLEKPDEDLTNIEKGLRNLYAEKLALVHDVESLKKKHNLQAEMIKELTFENEKEKEEIARLRKLCDNDMEKQETLDIALTSQTYKIQFLGHVMEKTESSMELLKKKVEESEIWTERCQEAMERRAEVEETIGEENLHLKMEIDSLEVTGESLKNEIQSLCSSEMVLKQEVVDGENQLEKAATYVRQLREKIHQVELQNKNVSVILADGELQIKALETKSINLTQDRDHLKSHIQELEIQIASLASTKEKLQKEKTVMESRNENLTAEVGCLDEHVKKLDAEVDRANKNLLELQEELKSQNNKLRFVTSNFDDLEKTKNSLNQQLENLLQDRKNLEVENLSFHDSLNSMTETNLQFEESLKQNQHQIGSLQEKEKLLTEEIESLKLNTMDIKGNHDKEKERLCSELHSLVLSEDELNKAVEAHQDLINTLNVQIESNVKQLEEKRSTVSTLLARNQFLQGKSEGLEVDVERLEATQLQREQEKEVLESKSMEVDMLISRVDNLSLENDGLKSQLVAAETLEGQLKQEVQIIVNESDSLASTRINLEQELEVKVNQASAFQKQIEILDQDFGVLELTIDEQRKEVSELNNQLEGRRLNATHLEQQLAETLKKIEVLESELQMSSEASTDQAATEAELSNAYESLLTTSREKEEMLVAENSAVRAEMSSAVVNYKVELDRLAKELEATRSENLKLGTLIEESQSGLEDAQKSVKAIKEELNIFAQDKQTLVAKNDARNQVEALIVKVNEKQSQLSKLRETRLRLTTEKEHGESQLTSYMEKNMELEQTVNDLRRDIDDMTVLMPPPSQASPYKFTPFLAADPTKSKQPEGEVSKKEKKSLKVPKPTPSKNYSRVHSTTKAAAFGTEISPIKKLSRDHHTIFSDTDSVLSQTLEDDLGFSQAKALPIGSGHEARNSVTTGAATSDTNKGKKTNRFFRHRPV